MVRAVTDIDDLNAQLTAAGSKLVVIDFYAVWCGPCKIIAPQIEEMEKQWGEEVVFLKVDVDEADGVAQKYDISAMPTFVFLKGSDSAIEKLVGANSEKLKDLIAKLK